MLDIVITHYQEPWAICKRQLHMLDAQLCVDWAQIRVTIVNDGGQRLPEEHLADLSFQVKQLDIPHGGVSRARNAGLENATEPWVMFCDGDDCLADVFALADILNVLQGTAENRYDMMWTKCWEIDTGADGRPVIFEIQPHKTFVFIHGKVYRRQFLLEQKIRFDEELTFNEDSCFNATILTRITSARVGEIKTASPAYCWIRRENSITTKPGAMDRSALGQLARNMKITEQTLIHRPSDYAGMVTRSVYDAYFMTHTRRFTPGCKKEILERFAAWATGRDGVFGDVKPDTLARLKLISRAELTDKDEQIPDDIQTVAEWLRRITE